MFKKIFEGKKAVIFDLDGTIFKEAEELRKQSFEKVLEKMNLSYIDPRPYCVPGYPPEEVWEAIIKAYEIKDQKIPDLVDKTRECYLEIVKNSEIEPAEGFWDLFYELKHEKNFKVGLDANTPKAIQEQVMEKLDIKNIFDSVVFGDDIKKLKPHPDIFKKIMKEMGVSEKETLVFEDSPAGVIATGKAKIDTIVISEDARNKSNFQGQVVDISPDFSAYVGRMDEGYSDYMARKIIESEEELIETANSL
ncbi:HAD family phosphatase [Patescibacteria group bacterium]|nr:HAD family phosphatase [Patescibacteria group bacterium]